MVLEIWFWKGSQTKINKPLTFCNKWTSKNKAQWNPFKPSSKIFYWLLQGWRSETGLSPLVKKFTDHSKAVLLLWIFYVFFLSCVCCAFVRVCLCMPCGHLLGKDWPLGSCLSCLTVSLSFSHWYPGLGVVLDCIDSWSLHSYLLSL